MTKKQTDILKAALCLFASNGFDNTSTSKIAKEAGVSEGLIFRHFGNKVGLLEAIMEHGQEKAQTYFQPLLAINEPKELVEAILEIPFRIEEEEFAFWRLLYSLKWQQKFYDRTATEFLRKMTIKAFTALGYSNPEAEANLIEVLIDGAATAILLREDICDKEELLNTIKSKYNLGKGPFK